MWATEKPYVDLKVTNADLIVASVAFGFTSGFGYFTFLSCIRETRRARCLNTYVILIWSELVVCFIFAAICIMYLAKIIPPSFAFFFTILTTWAFQVHFLLQIIVNRIGILLPTNRQRNYIRYSVAFLILLVNISVYNIWIPAKLQSKQRYIEINIWWDRCEKCIYLIVDAVLNAYFIYIVKQRLVVVNGLKKYQPLVNFNSRIILVSLAMDVLIIGMMSYENDFVYMQFHPVAYIVKLNIEMAMSQLIIKVARDTGVNVYEAEESKSRSNGATIGTTTMEVQIERQTHVTRDHAIELNPRANWKSTTPDMLPQSDQVSSRTSLEDLKVDSPV